MSMKQEENELYIIPPNFIESGTLFGGTVKIRNAIEAAIITLDVGLPIFKLPFTLTTKIMVACVIVLPLALFAIIGIDGESLSSFVINFFVYLKKRRIVGISETEEPDSADKQPQKKKGRPRKEKAPKVKKEKFAEEFGQVREKKEKPAKAKSQKRKSSGKSKSAKKPEAKAPEYSYLNPAAAYLPIEKIANGIIYTKDHRYVKIIEVVPINFLLRSAREQRNIIYSFVSYLKISPVKLQFKVLTRRADINRHLETIQAAEDGINPSKILILSGSGELAADMKEKEDFINASETAEQFEAEIDDTYDTFLSDTLKAGKNSNNQDMAEFLVESAEEAKNWVEGLGIKLTGVEKKDGSSLARSYTLADGGSLSEALSEALVKKVEDLKIPVKTGAEVKEIVMNADGVVTGVKAEIDGTEETIDSIAVVAADKDLLPVLSGMEIQLTKAADEKATGIIVNSCAEVLDAAGEPVPGIYAVGGLIDAGVHGEAVLPGNDLTATVVFGETAGVESAIYISDNRE